MIIRPDYVNEIKKFIDVPLFKVLSGVRREEKVYIQVCRDLPENSDRELLKIILLKEMIMVLK